MSSSLLHHTISQSYALSLFFFFFFKHPATTEIYTLSLHDALPISPVEAGSVETDMESSFRIRFCRRAPAESRRTSREDRKSTRLNSSHTVISYAVFCLKKKKKKIKRK